ncbi:hypothetical protein NMG60_11036653 [Bertholletia excelsa]
MGRERRDTALWLAHLGFLFRLCQRSVAGGSKCIKAIGDGEVNKKITFVRYSNLSEVGTGSSSDQTRNHQQLS